jgi:hypothetical protein
MIHDHADAHCLMKILKGSLKETRFNFPKNSATPPESIKETVYSENQVTYMSDELGLHKISNPDPENVAVSLHREFPCLACAVRLILTMYSLYTTKCCKRRLSCLQRKEWQKSSRYTIQLLLHTWYKDRHLVNTSLDHLLFSLPMRPFSLG